MSTIWFSGLFEVRIPYTKNELNHERLVATINFLK
jgi:hypothetical protein